MWFMCFRFFGFVAISKQHAFRIGWFMKFWKSMNISKSNSLGNMCLNLAGDLQRNINAWKVESHQMIWVTWCMKCRNITFLTTLYCLYDSGFLIPSMDSIFLKVVYIRMTSSMMSFEKTSFEACWEHWMCVHAYAPMMGVNVWFSCLGSCRVDSE